LKYLSIFYSNIRGKREIAKSFRENKIQFDVK